MMISLISKQLKSIRFYLLLILLISTLCYAAVLVPPEVIWLASLASYAIPVMLVINMLILIIIFIFRRKYVIYPIAGILLGFGFIIETISWSQKATNDKDQISLLSYNVKLFREYDTYDKFSRELIDWVINDTSDIKCIQEFCTNEKWSRLNTSLNIKKNGYQSYEYAAQVIDPEHSPGMAIFSKLPIVNKGMVWTETNTINGGMFVDVVKEKDTLRVYNIHLASMYLDLSHFGQKGSIIGKMTYLLTQLKSGAIKRSEQIKYLSNHTANCEYPYVIVGDFNETPYSFNYKSLSEQYQSSFRNAGRGLGFSYNGLLFFLRIDHQFYSANVKAHHYEVDRSIKVSDHFPTRALYSFDH